MERYYTLHLNGDTNYQIAEWPAPPTMRNDIQFRSDMAREYQVEPGEGNGWWVFIPPLAGKAEAEKKAGELRALEVTDYFILQDGPSRHAISLGVFSSEKGAQDRLTELKAKGVRSAKLMPRPGKDATVTILANGPDSARPAVRNAVAGILPKTAVQACP